MRMQVLHFFIFSSSLLKSVSAESFEYVDYDQVSICDQTYGNVIASFPEVQSSISCATICVVYDSCVSQTYNPTSKECRLNSGRLPNPVTTGCTSTLFYAEKPLCLVGQRCTLPLDNTRLCDGAGPGKCHASQGRLEVYLNGRWGSVCDDYWRDVTFLPRFFPNEIVVCRMYGFSSGVPKPGSFYGIGDGFLLDDVKCTGTEISIFQCPASPIGVHNCLSTEFVGVACSQL